MSQAEVKSAHCGTQSDGDGDGTNSDDWSFFDSTKLTTCNKFDCNTGMGQIILSKTFLHSTFSLIETFFLQSLIFQ